MDVPFTHNGVHKNIISLDTNHASEDLKCYLNYIILTNSRSVDFIFQEDITLTFIFILNHEHKDELVNSYHP